MNLKNTDVQFRYFQTWKYIPFWCAPVFHWLCGHTIGHELSITESGWDGSEWSDHWCRWCNLKIQTPAVSDKFVQDVQAGKVIPGVTVVGRPDTEYDETHLPA